MKGWFSCAQVWAGSQRGRFKDADGFHLQFKAIFISILEMSLGSGSKSLSNLSHLLQIIHLICPVHLFHPIYLIEDSERSEKEAEVSPVAIVSLKTRRHQLFPQFVCQSWSCGFSMIGGKLWKRKHVGFEQPAANANGNLLSRIKVSLSSKQSNNKIRRFWARQSSSTKLCKRLSPKPTQRTRPSHQYWFQLSSKQLCKTIKGVQLSHLKFHVWIFSSFYFKMLTII